MRVVMKGSRKIKNGSKGLRVEGGDSGEDNNNDEVGDVGMMIRRQPYQSHDTHQYAYRITNQVLHACSRLIQ